MATIEARMARDRIRAGIGMWADSGAAIDPRNRERFDKYRAAKATCELAVASQGDLCGSLETIFVANPGLRELMPSVLAVNAK